MPLLPSQLGLASGDFDGCSSEAVSALAVCIAVSIRHCGQPNADSIASIRYVLRTLHIVSELYRRAACRHYSGDREIEALCPLRQLRCNQLRGVNQA